MQRSYLQTVVILVNSTVQKLAISATKKCICNGTSHNHQCILPYN